MLRLRTLHSLGNLSYFSIFVDCGTLDQSAQYGLNMAINWDMAGYSDETTGHLGKAIPPGNIVIPGRIWLVQDGASWWHLQPTLDERCTLRAPRKQLLNDFTRLWTVRDNRILAFAKRNGVLSPWDPPDGIHLEFLKEWRVLSREVCALLNIGAALRSGNKSDYDPQEWQNVRFSVMLRRDFLDLQDRSDAQYRLQHQIWHWIENVGFFVDSKFDSRSTTAQAC